MVRFNPTVNTHVTDINSRWATAYYCGLLAHSIASQPCKCTVEKLGFTDDHLYDHFRNPHTHLIRYMGALRHKENLLALSSVEGLFCRCSISLGLQWLDCLLVSFLLFDITSSVYDH
jgi:hypothetical protein